jgi:transcriptional antiterminator NusG
MSIRKNFWYILYVKTGSEEKVITILNKTLNQEDYQPFLLEKVCIMRRGGKESFFRKNCFKGYVFIQSYKSPSEFIRAISYISEITNDFYKILNYGDKNDIAMRESERYHLIELFGNGYCMEYSQGLKEGQYINILSGPLAGYENKIRTFNKKNKMAKIEIELFMKKHKFYAGLELYMPQ